MLLMGSIIIMPTVTLMISIARVLFASLIMVIALNIFNLMIAMMIMIAMDMVLFITNIVIMGPMGPYGTHFCFARLKRTGRDLSGV